jgi:hypothetical protein
MFQAGTPVPLTLWKGVRIFKKVRILCGEVWLFDCNQSIRRMAGAAEFFAKRFDFYRAQLTSVPVVGTLI